MPAAVGNRKVKKTHVMFANVINVIIILFAK